MKTSTQTLLMLLGQVLISCFCVSSFAAADTLLAAAINLDDIEWGPPGGGNGFPVGVQTAQQGVNSDTGGIIYYAMFPAGSKFDSHWHTHDEFVVVAKGTLEISLAGETYLMKTGGYIVIPGKANHMWTVPAGAESAIILVRRAGPADFHFVSPH